MILLTKYNLHRLQEESNMFLWNRGNYKATFYSKTDKLL